MESWPASVPGITVSSTASVTPSTATEYGASWIAIVGSTIASWLPRTWCIVGPSDP
jgi:hypothetical protein